MKSAVIITAAGSSDRFNAGWETGEKKEFSLINKHSVLYYSTHPFVNLGHVSCIVVSCKDGCFEETEKSLEDLPSKKEFIFVKGGETRQKSVLNALQKLREVHPDINLVAIHDGARPFVSKALIENTFALASEKGAAAPGVSVTDTFVLSDKDGKIDLPLDRTSVRAVQTPQIFRFEEIYKAHVFADENKETFTDDTQVLMHYGKKVFLSQGSSENIKITFREDLSR